MAKISLSVRKEILVALRRRYASAGKTEKTRILDEFVALAQVHRKHAVRLLRVRQEAEDVHPRGRSKIYDTAVQQALVILWEASDRICGKRLVMLLPVLIPALEHHGHLRLDATVREKLLGISASSIDRLLAPAKSTGKPNHRRPKSKLRKNVPVRTFSDWGEPTPGFMEVDLVAHCGGNMGGKFVHTLTLTDIASGWTECLALVVRDSNLIALGLERLLKRLPFPLKGVDTDNGSEFINDVLIAYLKSRGIEQTRSRPYRKNDQAWVEQKNGAVVRRLVGYGRLEGLEAGAALARLYDSSRVFVNFYQPSFKLLSKERAGAKVKKSYLAPATPCARLLARGDVGEATKRKLQALGASADPLALLDEIRASQRHLARLAQGEKGHTPAERNPDLDVFLRNLATTWKHGEVRATHRRKEPSLKEERCYRTRSDPFELRWPEVLEWLESTPDATAKELFTRLRGEYPGEFSPGQLRTLQRRVKHWRTTEAQRLVLGPPGLPGGWDAGKKTVTF